MPQSKIATHTPNMYPHLSLLQWGLLTSANFQEKTLNQLRKLNDSFFQQSYVNIISSHLLNTKNKALNL